jgi:cell division protein FtsB
MMSEITQTMTKDREGKVALPRLWLFVLLVLGALVLGDLNQRMADARQLEQDAALMEDELAQLNEENAQLEAEIANANTDEYVEDWAHGHKWVREGEMLVILISPEGEETVSGPPAEPEVPLLTNMEIWVKFLIGP